MRKIIVLFVCAVVAACAVAPTSNPERFSRGCTVAGEAMVQVNAKRREGKIDAATFGRIADLYSAAVKTCDTLPATETASAVALEKVLQFLQAASGATGTVYVY